MDNRFKSQLVSSAALVAFAASALHGAVPARAQDVGTAAAVNPASTGTRPRQAPRTLQIGSGIADGERITTSPQGSVQVLFADKTTLAVGPGSDLVVDRFVYDAQRGSGAMALSVTRGVLRFVGGNVSHGGNAEVRTPNATLGIRGGVVFLSIVNGVTRVVLQFGQMQVTTPFGNVTVRRPGFVVEIGPNGLTGPLRVTQAEMNQILSRTISNAGQTGGFSGQIGQIVPGQVGEINAGLSPCSPGLQSGPSIGVCNPGTTPNPEQTTSQIVQQGTQQGLDLTTIRIEEPPPPYVPPPYVPPPSGCPPYCN